STDASRPTARASRSPRTRAAGRRSRWRRWTAIASRGSSGSPRTSTTRPTRCGGGTAAASSTGTARNPRSPCGACSPCRTRRTRSRIGRACTPGRTSDPIPISSRTCTPTRERMVAPRRLTRSLPSTVDPETLVEPVHVRYPGADGRQIPALLYVPYAEAIRGGSPPPAIVHIHGGPTGQHLRGWDRAIQYFANNGYVVLAPNIRGSTGYGREFQEANRGDWGGKDLQDVVKGAEWLAGQGIADRARIGAYGGSYGGFMTLLVLTQAPDVWAAGVSIVGVVSWTTLHETTRGDLKDYLERELGDPAKVPDLYRDRSPLAHVSKIKAPLLLLQGENDPRVPRSEADQMIRALRDGKKTFEEHIYPGEGHGFRTRENMIDSLRRATEWFDRHMGARA